VFAVVVAAACVVDPLPLHPTTSPVPVNLCRVECSDSIQIIYLGVGGFLIRYRGEAILTAPSVTHPNVVAVATPFLPLHADTASINAMMSPLAPSDVAAILVGHGHYDHLLDIPFTADRWTPSAQILGSPSTANILAAVPALSGRVRAVATDTLGTPTKQGTPMSIGGSRFFRVTALTSNHAPNVFRYTIANRVETSPRTSLPRTAFGWSLGETYAYLIDIVRADGGTAFRILYQDAAADSSYEHFPELDNGGAPIDVAIICAGNFGNVDAYPTALLERAHPKHVIVGHWEDFFRPIQAPFVGIPFNDLAELSRRITAVQRDAWVTPAPFARAVYYFTR
jgi:L-ascorbate metabolism protein UlaG (beta-lactamase superfamily)